MALGSTKMSFIVFLHFMLFLLQTTAGQTVVGPWGPWGACSKDCDGEQTRTRECTSTTSSCGALGDKRECNTDWCLSTVMILALAVIGAAILTVIVIIIVLLFMIRRNKTRERETKEDDMANVIERMYDDSTSTETSNRNQSLRHVPSANSFPEPLKEPEEIGLDSFAFETESLDESIREVSCSFGADEEYQPQAQAPALPTPPPAPENDVAWKIVHVTESPATDKTENLEVKEKPDPVYSIVMRPKTNDVKL